jgi:tetratricopeptide (TPR) repeat protein
VSTKETDPEAKDEGETEPTADEGDVAPAEAKGEGDTEEEEEGSGDGAEEDEEASGDEAEEDGEASSDDEDDEEDSGEEGEDGEEEAEPAAAKSAADAADKPTKMTPGERLAAAKARKAKKKAQKRGRQAELVEGRVLKQAERASSWAAENRNLLIAALVVVAVVAVGGTWWWVESKAQAAAAAGSLWDAVEASRADIRPEGNTSEDPDDDREVFESREAQAEAMLERAAETASEHQGVPATGWARLLEGRAALELGRHDDARSAFERALAEGSEDSELAAAALEGIAFAYEGEEEWDSAKERFEELRRLEGGAYENLADYHLARIHIAKGENDEAKELLRALVERLEDPEEEDEDAPELSYVSSQAQVRLMELDPSAVPTSAGSYQGGGGLDSMSPEEIQQLIQKLQSQGGPGGLGE